MRFSLTPEYSISRVIKGNWHLAGGHGVISRDQALRDMASFIEAGITTFDMADIYTGVEELVGEFRRHYPDHAAWMQIHTKCVPDLDKLSTLRGRDVEGIIDRSLIRLGVECLDLVQFHWWDYAVPGYVEALQTLHALQRAGKIRYIGLTNFDTAHVREICEAGVPIVVHQVQYSLLDDRPEHGMVDICREYGIYLVCYGTVAGGFLSEKWLDVPEPTMEELTNRSLIKYKLMIDEFGGWELFQEMLHVLAKIAGRHQTVIASVASTYVLQRARVAGVIVGATNTKHLSDNVTTPSIILDEEELLALKSVLLKRKGPQGDCYALERDRNGPHGKIMRYNLNKT